MDLLRRKACYATHHHDAPELIQRCVALAYLVNQASSLRLAPAPFRIFLAG